MSRLRLIYFGDNLEILRAHIADESVDLIYLDPPFKSQQEYNVLFRTVRGEPAAAQVRAFSDTWRWDTAARAAYETLLQDPRVPGRVARMVEAFYQFLGPSEIMAYLVMMTPRLLELHRVLKPTGSLYLHCDPAASHYLKVVLDTIFGPQNFRNEIIWKRAQPKAHVRVRFPRSHDVLLFYAKSSEAPFRPQYRAHNPRYIERFYRYVEPETGRRYHLDNLANPNKNRPHLTYEFPPGSGIVRVWRWTRERMMKAWEEGRIYIPPGGGVARYKRYLDEKPGATVTDLWDDIEHLHGSHAERLGYETQKPVALLRRIIEASSRPGDLVLDPFCGCGTALVAAEELGRSWIGIDITYLAVDVMARRLRDHFPGITFEVRGQPQDVEGARALAARDRFQFQVWALSLLGAQPVDPDRPGADRGIDGYLPFQTGPERIERAIVQVKSGHVGVSVVRDLRGVLERERAPFALLVTLEPPTREMVREAAEAGFYTVPATGEQVPRVQIVTIAMLLQGQRPQLPTTRVAPTVRAPRLQRREGEQMALPES